MLGLEGHLRGANALHALEVLSTIDKSALAVGSAVDEIWVVDGQLDGTVHNMVSGLDTLHERVILVAWEICQSDERRVL